MLGIPFPADSIASLYDKDWITVMPDIVIHSFVFSSSACNAPRHKRDSTLLPCYTVLELVICRLLKS